MINLSKKYKLDIHFKGPVYARSLGFKALKGPGASYEVLGKVKRNALILVHARTQDRVWS